MFGGGNIGDVIWDFLGCAPIKLLQDNTYGVGVTVTTPPLPDTPNFDGTVQSAPLIVSANNQIYPSVALETRAFYDQPNYQTRVTPEVGIEWIRMGRQTPIETTSTADVMITYWNHFDRVSASELNESYQNKILIWGMTAEDSIIQFLLHMVSCILMKYKPTYYKLSHLKETIQNNFLLIS